MKTLVTRVNCFIFFGEELCTRTPLFCIDGKSPHGLTTNYTRIAQNAEFTAAALEFPQAVIIAAEFLRITPGFLRPLVASMATNRHRAARMLHRYLVPIVEQRLAARDLQPNKATQVR